MQVIRSASLIACVIAVMCGCSKPSDSTPREAAATPSAAAAGSPKRFVFITNGDDPFWDACNAGLVEGATRSGLAAKGLRSVME